MNGSTSYVIIGVAVIAVLAGVLVFITRRKERRSPERSSSRQILILGIVFLIPGIVSLILDGESSVFLSLGVLFTLSGLVTGYLLKPSMFPVGSEHVWTGALVGFLLGGVIGAAGSMIFGYPDVIAILIFAALGSLFGIAFDFVPKRLREV